MAVSTGTIRSVNTEQCGPYIPGELQVARVLFDIPITETYAQANDGIINAVPTAIQNSRRNGKTATLTGACPGQSSYVASTGTEYRWLTAILNSTTVDATLYDGGTAAEYADDTALPTFGQPFSVFVSFIES